MQNGPAARPDVVAGSEQVASAAGRMSMTPGIEGIVLTSSAVPQVDTLSVPKSVSIPSRIQPGFKSDCPLNARAIPAPGGQAHLTIKAICHEMAEIQIHHSGLTFTALTDETGAVDITVPALSEYAIFLISLDDTKGTVATTHVTDISLYDRVALQWQGGTELQLHALEFGASYGQDGHVWTGPDANGAGAIVNLGQTSHSTARHVQVYSFPKSETDASGTIELSIEAEITQANCGTSLGVQALELRGDEPLTSRDLTLTLPDCSNAGEFLVLNNLLEDLTIAAK